MATIGNMFVNLSADVSGYMQGMDRARAATAATANGLGALPVAANMGMRAMRGSMLVAVNGLSLLSGETNTATRQVITWASAVSYATPQISKYASTLAATGSRLAPFAAGIAAGAAALGPLAVAAAAAGVAIWGVSAAMDAIAESEDANEVAFALGVMARNAEVAGHALGGIDAAVTRARSASDGWEQQMAALRASAEGVAMRLAGASAAAVQLAQAGRAEAERHQEALSEAGRRAHELQESLVLVERAIAKGRAGLANLSMGDDARKEMEKRLDGLVEQERKIRDAIAELGVLMPDLFDARDQAVAKAREALALEGAGKALEEISRMEEELMRLTMTAEEFAAAQLAEKLQEMRDLGIDPEVIRRYEEMAGAISAAREEQERLNRAKQDQEAVDGVLRRLEEELARETLSEQEQLVRELKERNASEEEIARALELQARVEDARAAKEVAGDAAGAGPVGVDQVESALGAVTVAGLARTAEDRSREQVLRLNQQMAEFLEQLVDQGRRDQQVVA